METNRINLKDTTQDALIKLAEGNPGALSVCIMFIKETAEIDPDSALGGLGNLLRLDNMGIYGSRIWMLYKDVCGQSINKTIAILRAHQLGFLGESELRFAIDDYGRNIDVNDLCEKVKEQLPKFNLGDNENNEQE